MSQLVGRGHRAGGKGGGLPGGRGQGGRVNGKGAIVSGSCGHLSGQAENVESNRQLPMGRCASPPWGGVVCVCRRVPTYDLMQDIL